MSDIMITVDTSQVKSAKQEMQELGGHVNSAINSASVFAREFNRSLGQAFREADRGAAFFREIARANQEIINTLQGVRKTYLSAEDSAAAFTEELRKQEAQALKTARANQDAFNKQLGVSGPSATSGGAGFGAIEAEILRLETMYNKVALAARVYEQAQESLDRALLMGVITADQQKAKLEELTIAYQRVGNSADNAQTFINRFGENAQVAGRGLNQFGMVAQQVGYQVGDFFVQIQSGTNFLVAFGQQATQLAGLIPGVWGAAIGIGISLTTAIGAAFMRATEDANGLTNAIDEQKAAYDRLVESIKQLRLENEMARSGAISTEEQRAINELEKLESNRIVLMLRRDEVQRQINENLEISRQGEVDALNAQIAQNEARQEEFRNVIRINRELEAQKFAREIAKKATQGLRDLMAQISQMDLSNPFWKMVDAIKAAVQEAKNLPMSTGTLDWAKNQLGFTLPGAELLPPEPTGSSGGGGGGGGARDQQSALEKLQEQLDLEKELVGTSEAYQRVRRALGEDFATTSPMIVENLIQQIESNEQLLELEKQREQLMSKVESSLENGFMAMVEGTKSVKDAFKQMAYEIIKELYRVLVVQRLVGGISGALGMATLPAGPSTGTLGLPKFASGGSMMPNRPYIVGEHGPELVIPRHSGTVVNANQTAGVLGNNSGATVVNNNISVTGSDAAMVRAEVAKMIPQITNATKAAVIEAKQRGGQMAAAFR